MERLRASSADFKTELGRLAASCFWQFKPVEQFPCFNPHDSRKKVAKKEVDSCIPESFDGNSSRQKLDSGPHIPDRIWSPR